MGQDSAVVEEGGLQSWAAQMGVSVLSAAGWVTFGKLLRLPHVLYKVSAVIIFFICLLGFFEID